MMIKTVHVKNRRLKRTSKNGQIARKSTKPMTLLGMAGERNLRKTAEHANIKLTGTSVPCEGCILATPKQKDVPKTSKVMATEKGETSQLPSKLEQLLLTVSYVRLE